MRKFIQTLGLVLALMGVSGTIDHLAVQPIFGFLNLFNREVIPRLGFLDGYELFANLLLAVVGGVLLMLADADEPAEGPGS
jgi:hypothetical protein